MRVMGEAPYRTYDVGPVHVALFSIDYDHGPHNFAKVWTDQVPEETISLRKSDRRYRRAISRAIRRARRDHGRLSRR